MVAMAAATPAMGGLAPPARNGIRYVVTDKRISASLAFAAWLENGGTQSLEVTEGLTTLWSEVLVPHWRSSGDAVAGLTSIGVWDALSQQAQQQFRRARILDTHCVDPSGRAKGHALEQDEAGTAAALAEGLEHKDWPLALALNAEACRQLAPTQASFCRIGNTQRHSADTRHFVSWIIE